FNREWNKLKAISKNIVILLVALVLIVSSSFLYSHPVSAEVKKRFNDPINLGSLIQSVAVYDSTYGVEDGRNIMYTTASGEPAIFQVIDLQSQEVLRTYPLEGTGA